MVSPEFQAMILRKQPKSMGQSSFDDHHRSGRRSIYHRRSSSLLAMTPSVE